MTQAAPQSDVVRFEMASPHVALVLLDRPAKRNAVSVEVTKAFAAIVAYAEAQIDIRAVVLASADPAFFCAGADLADVAAGRGHELELADGGFAGFVNAARRKPWIAAVDGPALAGGCELVLACDMVVAGEGATFGVPEVKRGLIAGAGGVHRLAKYIPRNIALEMIATGDPISAERAYQAGLANQLAAKGEARAAALALAERIAANAPVAVQESLAVGRQVSGCTEDEARALSRAALEVLKQTEDIQEGPRAFLEKRAPVWKGR